MDSCTIEGVANFYGLGIRLGFYAQWSALLLANFLGVAEEVPGIRVSFTVFVAATFLALVMEASHSALSHVDIYITLLVCFGYSFSMIPACSWTLLTEFNPNWDLMRRPHLRPSKMYNIFHCVLISAVVFFHLWFWTTGITQADDLKCDTYGFLFTWVNLRDDTFVRINITCQLIVLAICLFSLFGDLHLAQGIEANTDLFSTRSSVLHFLNTPISFITATVVIAGTELTVAWNRVTNVNTLSTPGQMIPFLMGIGALLHVLYAWLVNRRRAAWRRAQPVQSSLYMDSYIGQRWRHGAISNARTMTLT